MQASKVAGLDTRRGGQLVKMVTEGWLGRTIASFQFAIEESFEHDVRPIVTKDEVKRRFNFCVEGFCIMRKDLKWAVPRILDEIPTYLRYKLDGGNWKPDERRGAWNGKDDMGASDVETDDAADDMNPTDVTGD